MATGIESTSRHIAKSSADMVRPSVRELSAAIDRLTVLRFGKRPWIKARIYRAQISSSSVRRSPSPQATSQISSDPLDRIALAVASALTNEAA